MEPNRLTPAEVAKLEEAHNLMASMLPERIERARKLINEVLCSAAPAEKNYLGETVARTPAGFIDDKSGWDD